MRKIILLPVCLFLLGAVHAQQLHFMSQFVQHNPMYNPAAAGFVFVLVIGISYRSMWEAFTGNPRTLMVYGDTKWSKMNSGVAAYLYKDATGPSNREGVQIAYSYHVKTGEKSKLGLGFEVRGLQYTIDKSKLQQALGNDPVLLGTNNKFKLDGGIGAYYSNDRLSVGAAVSQLIESKLAFADVAKATLRAKLYRHYNFSASYVLPAGDDITVIPNFMSTVVPHAPAEFAFGVKLDYKDVIWWALNWRVKQAWSIQVGLKLFDKLSFVYAYDYYSEPFSDYNTGNNANEVGLRFNLHKKK